VGVHHPLNPVIGWVFETQTNKTMETPKTVTPKYGFTPKFRKKILEIVVGMKNEILIGIMKLLF